MLIYALRKTSSGAKSGVIVPGRDLGRSRNDLSTKNNDEEEVFYLPQDLQQIGSVDSQKQFYIQQKFHFPNGEKKSKVRIESRLGRKLGLTMAQLEGMNLDFSTLRVHSMQQVLALAANHPEYEFRLFLEAVMSRGPTTALQMLPTSMRLRYKRHMEKAQIRWWDPEDWLATLWPKTIKRMEPIDTGSHHARTCLPSSSNSKKG